MVMAKEEKESKGVSLIPANPWTVLIEGILILAVGIVLVAWPEATSKTVLIAFGIFALAFGGIQVYDAMSEKKEDKWWRIPLAVVSIIIGIVALVWPDATGRVALIVVGLWFVISGFLLGVAGLKLPSEITARWVVAIAGVVAVGIGIYLVIGPGDVSSDTFSSTGVRLIGIFAIIEGMLIAFYSFLLRKVPKSPGS
jgi:uncharacterized membrane protein HdeD (DUF308 family)